MKSIVYVGIDVHKDSYTLVCLKPNLEGEDQIFGTMKIQSDYHRVLQYLERMQKILGEDVEFICAYEAGCMGYSLYHQLTGKGVKCFIIAPTSLLREKSRRIKTDKRDAINIAKSLAYGTGRHVHVPSAEDEMVQQYIRMRDDHRKIFKSLKQQILALCLRSGNNYSGMTNWTKAHLEWLRKLELDWLLRETLDEYLATYGQLSDKLAAFERRIEELAKSDRYREDVGKLSCFVGIKTYSALAILVETGDFERFPSAGKYAAYLGLVPGERTSDEDRNVTGITKSGNSHLRRILIESSQSLCKGAVGYKSRALKTRQKGNSSQTIAYADRCNERLRRKYYQMMRKGKNRNVSVTAIARELACFIWGMMTANTKARDAA